MEFGPDDEADEEKESRRGRGGMGMARGMLLV